MSDAIKSSGFQYRFRLLNQDGSIADEWAGRNLIPQDGLAFLLQSPFGAAAPISTFYAGLFRGNVIPTAGLKATDIPSNLQEFVGYSQPARPLWNRVFDSVGTQDNAASKAEFTCTVDATLYGSFLGSDSAKGGGNGLLLSVVRFPSPKMVTAGQTLQLIAGITYVPTNVI